MLRNLVALTGDGQEVAPRSRRQVGAGLACLGWSSTDRNTKCSSGPKGTQPFEEEWLLPPSSSLPWMPESLPCQQTFTLQGDAVHTGTGLGPCALRSLQCPFSQMPLLFFVRAGLVEKERTDKKKRAMWTLGAWGQGSRECGSALLQSPLLLSESGCSLFLSYQGSTESDKFISQPHHFLDKHVLLSEPPFIWTMELL